jgi:hypothetical protein
MTINPVILKLTSEEVLRLKRILLDDDKQEALLFLRQCLKPQLDREGRSHMLQAFENI